MASAVVSIASRSRQLRKNCGCFFFDEAVPKTIWPGAANSAAGTSCSCLNGLRGNVATAVVSIASRYRKSGGKLRTPYFFFFDEAVAKTFWPRSADFDAEASCSCLDSLRSNVAGAVVSIASRYRKSGENCERLIFFFDEAVAKTFWPRSADFDAEASCSCLDSLRSNVAGAVVSIASRYSKSGGKLRTPNFLFTRTSSRLSGPDQPTPLRELPAAALTAFVATLPPPWFPLPPGLENQGENCERLIFFFDEAVAKTFWPRSADFDAEASCSCLDSLRGNVAGAVVSIASRYRKSGGKLRAPNFFF